MRLKLLLGGLVALGFVVVSTAMAARFGWTLGTTDEDRWLYATAGGLADVLKALLPLFIVGAWYSSQYVRVGLGTLVFVVFTGYSLTSSFGLAAYQRAEHAGVHSAAAAQYRDLKKAVADLRTEKAALTAFTPATADAVRVANAAVQSAIDQRSAECDDKQKGGGRGTNCRAREADERKAREDLAKVIANKALTDRAADLDRRLASAELALSRSNAVAAVTEADPQSAAISKVTGLGEDTIRAGLQLLVALLLELGSGLGFYMVFGHHGQARATTARTPLPEGDGRYPALVDDGVQIEQPSDAVNRFLLERVQPVLGSRISGSEMYAAYEGWCTEQGMEPVTGVLFGRIVQWRKAKVGGRVWYLDAMVRPAARLRLAAQVHEFPTERTA